MSETALGWLRHTESNPDEEIEVEMKRKPPAPMPYELQAPTTSPSPDHALAGIAHTQEQVHQAQHRSVPGRSVSFDGIHRCYLYITSRCDRTCAANTQA